MSNSPLASQMETSRAGGWFDWTCSLQYPHSNCCLSLADGATKQMLPDSIYKRLCPAKLVQIKLSVVIGLKAC